MLQPNVVKKWRVKDLSFQASLYLLDGKFSLRCVKRTDILPSKLWFWEEKSLPKKLIWEVFQKDFLIMISSWLAWSFYLSTCSNTECLEPHSQAYQLWICSSRVYMCNKLSLSQALIWEPKHSSTLSNIKCSRAASMLLIKSALGYENSTGLFKFFNFLKIPCSTNGTPSMYSRVHTSGRNFWVHFHLLHKYIKYRS